MSDRRKNRAQNCLTVSNLKLDDVFSDVFGKSAISTEYILAHLGEHFDVSTFVDRRCKHPIEEIQAAVDDSISREQATKLRECLDHIDELKRHHEQIEIYRLAEPYAYSLELLRTILDFSANPLTAIALISEIGVDMSVFPTAKPLCSWADYCPRNDGSGGKIKSTKISRASAYLKLLLIQVANAVIKSNKNPEFKKRYRRIKARRGHKKIIAICRMILVEVWNILSKLEPYTLCVTADIPVPFSKELSLSQALTFLKLRGYVIKDDLPTVTYT